MEKQYTVTGMTCTSCVAKVKKALEAFPGIQSANVQRESPQVTIVTQEIPNLKELQHQLHEAGDYHIEPFYENTGSMDMEISGTTYRPLIMIVAFIFGVSLLTQYPFKDFSWMEWMRFFMAGFFIVFSFFKLLNPGGFADMYRTYDIVAAKWKGWGFVYPYVELALGIMYFIDFLPVLTNATTFVVLGVSSIGVIKSNLDKRKIKCACLGDVFNLPMSTVTIVEDLSMVAMATVMLVAL